MKKILLVNGPPRSGKDTVGRIVSELVPDVHVTKFAHALKSATHALFLGLHGEFDKLDMSSMEDNCLVCSDDAYYEAQKDVPGMVRFFGITPRKAYILVSEVLCKPTLGKQVFGDILADAIERRSEEYIVVTDSGFVEEAGPLVKRFGVENMDLAQVSRPGCNFRDDSRSYIQFPGVRLHRVSNVGTESSLRWTIHNMLLPSIGWTL